MLNSSRYNHQKYVAEIWEIEHNRQEWLRVDDKFINDHRNNLKKIWSLTDPMKNVHYVEYHIEEYGHYMRFGWPKIRESYGLQGRLYYELNYIGSSKFDLMIYDSTCAQIHYPVIQNPDFQIKLTDNMAKSSNLWLPKNCKAFMLNHLDEDWFLRGPTGNAVQSNILYNANKGSVKFGVGWKNFIRQNNFRKGNTLTFMFGVDEANIIKVFVN